MNKVELGAGVLAGLALIGWIIWQKLHKCEADLAVTSEELKDAEIREQVHALSDSDLNARLDQDSGKRS